MTGQETLERLPPATAAAGQAQARQTDPQQGQGGGFGSQYVVKLHDVEQRCGTFNAVVDPHIVDQPVERSIAASSISDEQRDSVGTQCSFGHHRRVGSRKRRPITGIEVGRVHSIVGHRDKCPLPEANRAPSIENWTALGDKLELVISQVVIGFKARCITLTFVDDSTRAIFTCGVHSDPGGDRYGAEPIERVDVTEVGRTARSIERAGIPAAIYRRNGCAEGGTSGERTRHAGRCPVQK